MSSDRMLVVGHLTLDQIVQYARRTVRFDTPQGNGLISAIGARMWSSTISLISRMGHDYPLTVLTDIERRGIDVSRIHRVDSPSLKFWILRELGDVCQDYPLASANWEAMTPRLSDGDLPEAKALHVAPIPYSAQLDFVRIARQRDLVCSADAQPIGYSPSAPKSIDELKLLASMCDVFFISTSDVSARPSEVNAASLAETLSETCPGIVVVRASTSGSFIFSRAARIRARVPIFPTIAIDTTGAGDAYAAAFTTCYADTKDAILAAAAATASASFVVETDAILECVPSKDKFGPRHEYVLARVDLRW